MNVCPEIIHEVKFLSGPVNENESEEDDEEL